MPRQFTASGSTTRIEAEGERCPPPAQRYGYGVIRRGTGRTTGLDGATRVVPTVPCGGSSGDATADPSGKLFGGCGIWDPAPAEAAGLLDTGCMRDSWAQAVKAAAASETTMRPVRIRLTPLTITIRYKAIVVPQKQSCGAFAGGNGGNATRIAVVASQGLRGRGRVARVGSPGLHRGCDLGIPQGPYPRTSA